MLSAAVHESENGPLRRFAAVVKSGRFRSEADMNRPARSAASVENDPLATLALRTFDRAVRFP
jgi:hypothetical protein